MAESAKKISSGGLHIDQRLYALVAEQIAPGTGVDVDHFWAALERKDRPGLGAKESTATSAPRRLAGPDRRLSPSGAVSAGSQGGQVKTGSLEEKA